MTRSCEVSPSPGLPIRTLYAPLLSPERATCRANLILLDFITQMAFGEEYGA